MEMHWEKYFLIKDSAADEHTESAMNTPFVTEQMTESVQTTSLWPSWNGKSEKPLFIHKLAHTCI